MASPDTEDIGDAPSIWELINDEIYSRGADGKELAIFLNGNLKQNNIWGLGNEGYITNSDFPNFYVKDYLGSIRAITDENNSVISAQDYDAWGYLMQSRVYESDGSVHKFIGKERDKENNYDYFGARYYDARVGTWKQVEPKIDNIHNWSSFVYCIDNPLRVIDPYGLDWFYNEETKKWEYIENASFMINVNYDFATGNTTTSIQQGEKEFLEFQGSSLTWYYRKGSIRMWNARSGVLDDQNRTQPELQNERDKGPIPQGWYNINPNAAHYYPYEIGKGKLWKIWPYAPDEETLRNWGRGWVPLTPTRGNATTRSNFFIHGGLIPGSIGCIDLMGGIDDFLIEFINNGKPLDVNVRY